MGLTIRPITDHEIEAFRACFSGAFAFDTSLDPDGVERLRALLDLRRTYCAFEGAQLVASAAAFDFQLSIPGAIVAMAGLTLVAVRPTHRRQGILRRIMAAHLLDVGAHHEPLSGLWASEGGIYGRFGYGVAAEGNELSFSLSGDQVGRGHELDEVTLLDESEAARELPSIYARALEQRPGMLARSPDWWTYRRFADPPYVRGGRSPRRHVVACREGKPTGYIVYRQTLAYEDGSATGRLEIEELVALDPRAEITLFRFAASVDLFPKVSWWNAPNDALLPWLVPNRRNVVRKRCIDTLWLNVCDVAAALSARRYAADGKLSIKVDECTFRLEINAGVGLCTQQEGPPQLSLSRAALASIFMGSVAPSLLARAGLVTGSDTALAEADRLFRWPIAPWCPEIF